MSGAVPVQRVSLRVISHNFAFADVTIPGVSLKGIEARRNAVGAVTLTCPSKPGRDGRPWPLYALQPGTLEAVTDAVARTWYNMRSAEYGLGRPH
ncbi:hypothetical protein [Roseomonas chloroacetimidivorans]|uniref:hypothetical protein n=1 Tax=Roseomonas chloroacetimidivorans TaxID=1766656 RepID=UPI003C7389AD